MYRVYQCLTQEHDLTFVALAAVVCTVGCYLAIQLAGRVLGAGHQRRQVLIWLFAIIGGSTVWSTHFIAMLAYDPGAPHGYAPFLTGVSLVIAVGGMSLMLRPLHAGHTLRRIVTAGCVLGLTVTAMHYTGMAAYQIPGVIVWDPAQVLLSIGLGCALACLGLHRIVSSGSSLSSFFGQMLLVLAICSMHFTGMSAFSIEFSPLVDIPRQGVSDQVLGWLIAGVTFFVLLIGFAALHADIQAQQEALRASIVSATHDPLTKLPNRNMLHEKLAWTEDTMKLGHAVLTLDLDRFGQINELHGYDTGDAVLVDVANRLAGCLDENEFVARIGSNSFVGIKSDISNLDEAKRFAEKFQAACDQPSGIGHLQLRVQSSVGVAASWVEWVPPDWLLQWSEVALQVAKKDRASSMRFYDADMDRQQRAYHQLAEDLSFAIERNELRLVYQVQNDAATGVPVGAEALLRWQHAKQGDVSPDKFIPIAEETGLIRAIGLWVLEQACLEAATWPKDMRVAVNVAPAQIAEDRFAETLGHILTHTGLDPHRLELEVTERGVIDDQDRARVVIEDIKRMGVRIAMDDFGTGFSSLATLRALPFDKIKIDQSFIRDIHQDGQKTAIVRAVMLLGEAMDLPILAEGVETPEEMAFLQNLGCDQVQGFLFGKPLEVADLPSAFTPEMTEIAS